jgi:uncharacterized protein (DUF697 family)
VGSYEKDSANKWVYGYAATGGALVIAAIVPGSTSVALMGIEATMAYHIGKIYENDFTMDDATALAKRIGLASVMGKVAALEALNFVPFAGWAVKGPVAAGIIKLLGNSIIEYFESKHR